MIDSKFIKKWERKRKKGKTLYIIIAGIIISIATVAGAITAYLFTGSINFDITAGMAIGGLIGGSIGGSNQWKSNEEKYKKLTDANQN